MATGVLLRQDLYMCFVHIELLFESYILPTRCLSIQCVKIDGLICGVYLPFVRACVLFREVIVASVTFLITRRVLPE